MNDDLIGRFELDSIEDNLVPYLFLREHRAKNHRYLARRDIRGAVPMSVLPVDAEVAHRVGYGACADVLAMVGDVVVLLRTWTSAGDVWASGADAAAADAVVADIISRVPQPPLDGRVGVSFTDAEIGNRYLKLDVRPWADIRSLYPDEIRTAMDRLVDHRPGTDGARRLILWRGPAGTGKTTAIRALLDAWRCWAEGIIVTDPETLMRNGKYLRRTVLNEQDDERWSLVVLEDAEALTNEPLGSIHPAVVRPGRCLATVEFGPLPAAHAAAILGRPVSKAMTLAGVMTQTPVVTVSSDEVAVGQYL